MRLLPSVLLLLLITGAAAADGDYSGDERCKPPADWSEYSEPYYPHQHPHDYPTFEKADKPGWCCSYQREDGVFVQYGDCRTPQEQWLAVFGGGDGNND